MIILGISAFYHDSAVALIQDGRILFAAQEERYTRKKHDPVFPEHALREAYRYCNISPDDVDYVVFYEKRMIKYLITTPIPPHNMQVSIAKDCKRVTKSTFV